ncbi:UNVERIFIED_CONTAM: ABC transporter ATP-binding protein [Campylobacter lari]
MNILEVKELNKVYKSKKGLRGVKNISFNILNNSFHAFIGENGAGKTTTIKCIIGAYYNFSGEIMVNGINHNDLEAKKILGYVPEHATFPKDLTVYDYLLNLAKINQLNLENIKEKIDFYLNKFNILDLKFQKPAKFSSGQKKKILLIQALLHDPKLIILDEPAANLDPTARFELFETLKELFHSGKSILISSHVLAEIDKYTDSLTLIHKGEIVYSGKKYKPLEEIYNEKILTQ